MESWVGCVECIQRVIIECVGYEEVSILYELIIPEHDKGYTIELNERPSSVAIIPFELIALKHRIPHIHDLSSSVVVKVFV